MVKTIKIRNEYFEVIKPRKYKPVAISPNAWNYSDIWSAYDKPSYEKVRIWNYWDNFFGDEMYKFGLPLITSKTHQFFTISFNVFDAKTSNWVGVAVITANHNRLFLA